MSANHGRAARPMRVKNWEKFQHYKHRDPPWIRLYRGLLNDPEWHSLDGEHAKALVMIWLVASESDGVLPELRNLAFRMRISEQQCASLLPSLSHWLVQDDSAALAPCLHDATPETDTEADTETEREGVASAPPSPKVSKRDRKRASGLPDGFEPDWSAATSAGLSRTEAERELQKFKNYAAQNGRVCIDWQAAWRNWCLKAAEYLKKPLQSAATAQQAPMISPDSPSWNAWRAHYRDTGQNARAAMMDRFAAEGKPFTVPSAIPPARKLLAQTG